MNYFDFTAEETNMVSIYAQDTRAATLAAVTDALPHMDAEMRGIASRSLAKLAAMTDSEFAETAFAPAGEGDDDE
jgi:hypothetical protein